MVFDFDVDVDHERKDAVMKDDTRVQNELTDEEMMIERQMDHA